MDPWTGTMKHSRRVVVVSSSQYRHRTKRSDEHAMFPRVVLTRTERVLVAVLRQG